MRADVFLVEHGYASTRAEAQAAIRSGKVSADGARVAKASQPIAEGAAIEYAKEHPYVSRGALKLIAALDRFGFSPDGLVCLDIGASTGGFTEVLLERGARKVFAVDVGHGQLHPKLTSDPRVVSLERTDIRKLDISSLPGRIGAVTADVSFISLKLALAEILNAAENGTWLVALVKPQFEVGREKIGKGGIVRDTYAQAESAAVILQWIAQNGWKPLGMIDSPILGGDGNREVLIAVVKDGEPHGLIE